MVTVKHLQEVFDTSNLTGGQQLFLKCLAVLPKVKQLYGDDVTEIDKAIAEDAQTIVKEERP